MHVEVLVVVMVAAIGIAAFFFGIFYALFGVLRFVWRCILGGLGLGRPRIAPTRSASMWSIDQAMQGPALGSWRQRPNVCVRPRCHRVEYRQARYCSQCGAPLAKSGVDRNSG